MAQETPRRRYISDQERKDYSVQIFLKPAEFQKVREMALADGHSMSAVLRKLLIPAINAAQPQPECA